MASAVILDSPLLENIRTGRELLDKRRREPAVQRLRTTIEAFDRLLCGGLERGSMVELVGGRSSGRLSIVLHALGAVTSAGEAAALIDLGDGLDPRAAAAAKIDLRRLLWARPKRIESTLASAEVILQCGMPLVVIDLGLPPLAGGRGNEASWLRLARAADNHQTALLIASPYRVSGTAAAAVVRAHEVRAQWSSRQPPLLQGFSTWLDPIKRRRSQAPHEGHHLSLSSEWQI